MNPDEMTSLIADSLEQGMAENVISLMRQEPENIALIPFLLKEERARVRLGTMIVIEELSEEKSDDFRKILKTVWELLDDENEIIRGDAAYALSLMKFNESVEILKKHLNDKNQNVKEIIQESIEVLTGESS